jgi:hypothetical protein
MLDWLDVHVNALVTQKVSTGPTMLSAAPVMEDARAANRPGGDAAEH